MMMSKNIAIVKKELFSKFGSVKIPVIGEKDPLPLPLTILDLG